jgi:hypothetical protein
MNNGRSVIIGSAVCTIIAIVVLASCQLSQAALSNRTSSVSNSYVNSNGASATNNYMNDNTNQHSNLKIVNGKGNGYSGANGGFGGNADGGEASIANK